MTTSPTYTPSFIIRHMTDVVSFYHPRCIDPAGGYFPFFRESGEPFSPQDRHLVGTARMVVNYSVASLTLDRSELADAARHGIEYLRAVHRNKDSGGYAWLVSEGRHADATNHAYGLAFVMLAYARAVLAGVDEAMAHLYETWRLLEARFWEPPFGLYADEASPDWRLTEYRGQNANMHLCEALIAAYEATDDRQFLERAEIVADHMTNRQAALAGGQVWEHYRADWSVDWEYNKGVKSNLFRPWGFQPGHQFEWAKLLLLLDAHLAKSWHLPRAEALFLAAAETGWDRAYGGFVYGCAPDGSVYDREKYGWVQMEAMAAAAWLFKRTERSEFESWYERIGDYAWQTFVDASSACWHRWRKADNADYAEPAPFSGLTDYHTICGCADIIRAFA